MAARQFSRVLFRLVSIVDFRLLFLFTTRGHLSAGVLLGRGIHCLLSTILT